MLLQSRSHEEFSRFVDFTKTLSGGRSWREVLQCKVWVSAGSDEIFLFDITRFVDVLMRDGVEVDFDVMEGEMHGGRLFDDVFDESAYLGSIGPGVPDGIMEGSATLTRAILEFKGYVDGAHDVWIYLQYRSGHQRHLLRRRSYPYTYNLLSYVDQDE